MEDHTDEQFVEADFSGARFHGVIFSNVEISDAWLSDVGISGLVRGLSVNGIDVTDYVEAELDRRHPERLLLTPDDPAGARLAWRTIEDFSAATLDRARALPPHQLDVSVNGEWSFVETLRHLVFATDRWIVGPVLGDPNPFHRLGRPNDPLDEVPAGRFDVDARPTLDEVLAVRSQRMDRVADLVELLDADELDRDVTSPNGGATTVGSCLHVVFREEWWHDQYANRDLAILESDQR
ncbi:MAG: DinB family protein [Acidimicrobiales bacterium]